MDNNQAVKNCSVVLNRTEVMDYVEGSNKRLIDNEPDQPIEHVFVKEEIEENFFKQECEPDADDDQNNKEQHGLWVNNNIIKSEDMSDDDEPVATPPSPVEAQCSEIIIYENISGKRRKNDSADSAEVTNGSESVRCKKLKTLLPGTTVCDSETLPHSLDVAAPEVSATIVADVRSIENDSLTTNQNSSDEFINIAPNKKRVVFTGMACMVCHAQLDTEKKIQSHMEAHYKDQKICSKFHKSLVSNEQLIWLLNTTKVKFINCKTCNEKFVVIQDIKSRLNVQERLHRAYTQCSKCKNFILVRDIGSHVEAMHETFLTCLQCDKFFSVHAFHKHETYCLSRSSARCSTCHATPSEYTMEPPEDKQQQDNQTIKFPTFLFECMTCGQVAADIEKVISHFNFVHSGQVFGYNCPICEAYIETFIEFCRHVLELHKGGNLLLVKVGKEPEQNGTVVPTNGQLKQNSVITPSVVNSQLQPSTVNRSMPHQPQMAVINLVEQLPSTVKRNKPIASKNKIGLAKQALEVAYSPVQRDSTMLNSQNTPTVNNSVQQGSSTVTSLVENNTSTVTNSKDQNTPAVIPLSCIICRAEFTSRPFLVEHLQSHDQTWPCIMCPKRCLYDTELRDHTHSHSLCVACNLIFNKVDNFKNHLELHRKGEVYVYKCTVCGWCYQNRRYLQIHHRERHAAKDYNLLNTQACMKFVKFNDNEDLSEEQTQCFYCLKVINKKGLSRHLAKQHLIFHCIKCFQYTHVVDIKNATCSFCKRTFKTKLSNVQQHPCIFELGYGKECTRCFQTFLKPKDEQEHALECSENIGEPFLVPCIFCNKPYIITALEDHLLREHDVTREEPTEQEFIYNQYRCPVCKIWLEKTAMEQHIVTMHRILNCDVTTLDMRVSNTPLSSIERIICCSYCNFDTSSYIAYKQHLVLVHEIKFETD